MRSWLAIMGNEPNCHVNIECQQCFELSESLPYGIEKPSYADFLVVDELPVTCLCDFQECYDPTLIILWTHRSLQPRIHATASNKLYRLPWQPCLNLRLD